VKVTHPAKKFSRAGAGFAGKLRFSPFFRHFLIGIAAPATFQLIDCLVSANCCIWVAFRIANVGGPALQMGRFTTHRRWERFAHPAQRRKIKSHPP
jgi:hypothetical protein